MTSLKNPLSDGNGPHSSSAKWRFSLRTISDLLTELCPCQGTAQMLTEAMYKVGMTRPNRAPAVQDRILGLKTPNP